MKRRTLQEEAIGTAAVDLFASGMGAFILIALLFIVLLAANSRVDEAGRVAQQVVVSDVGASCPDPITTNPVCPPPPACPEILDAGSCPEPVVIYDCPETPVEVPPAPRCPVPAPVPDCPVCPQLAVATPSPESESSTSMPAPDARTNNFTAAVGQIANDTIKILPDFDLVLVLDSTSSMVAEIEALKRNLYIVVEVLEQIMPSVGIGVITFNDRQQKPVVQQHPIRKLTGDDTAMVRLQRFLRGIRAGGAKGSNPDSPEAVLTALRSAVALGFRPEVRNRSIIVITDSYAYDDERSETLRLAREFASVPGQRVSTVHVDSNRDAETYLKELSESGGGSFVPDRGSILANILLTVL